jgi:solute carrier family 35 protein F3/4
MIAIPNEDISNRDNEIAAIFNPKRAQRTPSVVVTGDSPNNNGPICAITNANQHQITHSDSITSSQPDGAESLTGVIIGDHADHLHHQPNSLTQIHPNPRSSSLDSEKTKGCKGTCCSDLAQKASHPFYVLT